LFLDNKNKKSLGNAKLLTQHSLLFVLHQILPAQGEHIFI